MTRTMKYVSIITLSVVALSTVGCSRAPRSVTVFRAYCPAARNADGQCPVRERAGIRIRYRAFPATQTVVYATESAPPRRLTNCVVQDAKNWGCGLVRAVSEPKYPAIITMPKSGKKFFAGPKVRALIQQKFQISMVNGIIHQPNESRSRNRQVSRFKWYALKLGLK